MGSIPIPPFPLASELKGESKAVLTALDLGSFPIPGKGKLPYRRLAGPLVGSPRHRGRELVTATVERSASPRQSADSLTIRETLLSAGGGLRRNLGDICVEYGRSLPEKVRLTPLSSARGATNAPNDRE